MEGCEIIIRDNKTKEDVTREVLISILMEETIGGEPLFTENLMKMIIRFYGNPMQDMFVATLEQSQRVLNSLWPTVKTSKVNIEEK